MLASRLARIQESATLEVSRRAAALRARGVAVVDLGVGEPDFPSPPLVVEAAQRALGEGFTRYTAAAGIPELRRALAERYARRHGAPWGADQVVVTVGAKAALFELALALFEPGHEVLLPTPAWVSFAPQVELAGAAVVPVPMRADDGFAVHADRLIAAMTPRTRAVIVNSPCNPTGGMMSAVDLERLVEAAAAAGVLVIADETYDQFVYDGARHASAAALAARFPDTVVVVGSFSKTWAMTGWRLGWACAPPEIIDGVLRVQGHATSNPTSFAMSGALAALAEPEAEMARRLAEFQVRRDLVAARLAAMPGVRCAPPGGAFYAFPDVSECFDEELGGSLAVARYLLEEAHVAVVPGEAFGADAHVRLSFACSRETLAEGLDRMTHALGALRDSGRRLERRAAATPA
ncbi:MAG TPA: pyridoxal phosphate-dependent aminotransferase [Thermoanaerobaculia bacterium]|jgi:aspartate aminotransferase|nr:pyridoxal phosphate-dependent aminotransferase [Thermoanaerobaculia bacterium]